MCDDENDDEYPTWQYKPHKERMKDQQAYNLMLTEIIDTIPIKAEEKATGE